MKKRAFLWVAFALAAAGCTPFLIQQLNGLYGEPNSARYDKPLAARSGVPEYHQDVQPILEKRCVACHGCYDAPCQLKLTRWEGLARGASPDQVYAQRLFEAPMTRLNIDATYPSQWRNKNFHPILNERADTPEANLQGSVLYRLLALKNQHPLPTDAVLDKDGFDFSLNREQQCTTIEKIDVFEKKYPQWGMPYGLPALDEKEFSTLKTWLKAGAPVKPVEPLSAVTQRRIKQWETFFNGTSPKQQLVSRYIFEHLFLAHIYFDPLEKDQYGNRLFFRLVRSSTAPGSPVVEIASRRPYDDPGVTFWYRLVRDTESVVEKTHMPYRLDQVRLAKWQKWFLGNNYQVTKLPSYAPDKASNPFVTFEQLPINARYRFLLDEAQFVVDTFIKGPVCRGQIALSVIEEHFWVFFVNPDAVSVEELDNFLSEQSDHLYLPASEGSNGKLIDWLKYSKQQKKYLKAKAERIKQRFDGKAKMDLSFIWNGENQNDNVALTIFRHTDNATVVKGLVGKQPKTSWVISYPLFERIYYLLVAGFDIYGNASHQLNTRLYMDFLRMEGESNFLMLLPERDRATVRDYWYRGANKEVKAYLFEKNSVDNVESGITYKTNDAQAELYTMLRARVGNALNRDTHIMDASVRQGVAQIEQVAGAALSWFPQNSVMRITTAQGGVSYVTLVNDLGYSNISELFDDAARRRPDEDYLTVVPGVLGAYPNAFFDVQQNDLPDFARQLAALKGEADYARLADRYAVRRTNPAFWAFSDELQAYIKREEPISGGILDYNRFENR